MKSKPSKKTPAKKSAAPAKKESAAAQKHEHEGHDCCDHDHGGHDHCGGGLEIGIRLYKAEDYKELRAVWKAGDILCDDTDSAKELKECSEKRKNHYRIFVAEASEVDGETGKPVGKSKLVAGVVCTYDGRRVYLYHFAVHPDFRGLGLGTALLDMCEHQATLWGAKHMRLMSRTDPMRESARSLYEKNGWVPQKNLQQYAKEIK